MGFWGILLGLNDLSFFFFGFVMIINGAKRMTGFLDELEVDFFDKFLLLIGLLFPESVLAGQELVASNVLF